ncbi:MAG: hypothetical protein EU547_01670 [Promethearchaeota archaeon]|nr:MAG: hypothetical protein EU547_01670 [Candidatus Lokiarchaeota archaeon]
MSIKIFHEADGNISVLENKLIAVLGFGNQAKAQALNMRDSGLNVIVGTSKDEYKVRATEDGFQVFSLEEAVKQAEIIFLLISDDILKDVFKNKIIPNLKDNKTLVFSTGYYLTYNILTPPKDIDVLLISPRGSGEMIRKQYLNMEGLFSFISIVQDVSGNSRNLLLGLTKAIGGLSRAGIEMSIKQQTVLQLFIEQAFLPAFNLVMMKAIRNLVDEGYSPEAIFIELILSEEMIFTVDKMIEVGLVRQMNFHSQTSQYGSLSRGIKFSKVGDDITQIQEVILEKIEDGSFAEEWESEETKEKLNVMKNIAYNSNFWELEKKVYNNLNFSLKFKSMEKEAPAESLEGLRDQYKTFYEEI